MKIADATERATALDTGASFCVTAPAGSGKTELLIQRFLALLGRVERPEQVLAITFTRKAAAEMRERVMLALHQAREQLDCDSEHQRVTRRLAQCALAASAERDWHLTRDVSRLNIKTIDSFCAGLTRQMPVLSQFGGQAQTLDLADDLYVEAVADLFELLDTQQPVAAELSALLLHFDNNWDRLAQLLVAMLGKRDQWHEYMGSHHTPQESEARLLGTVEAVVGETLAELAERLDGWQDEILDLLCYARGNLGEPMPEEFPAPVAADTEIWRSLRNMLLIQSGKWRSAVDVRQGFPKGKGEATERKQHLLHLVGRLSAVPGLDAELHALAWLPDMRDNSSSWRMVLHLSHVLPTLSACLLLVFLRRGQVDHTQVALSAIDALGDDDRPTELALRLDYSIEHILVDEFQDTAINQYRLVDRLTRGWGQHNAIYPERARTIFIVGDGMQSIYGFRNANVGLFLRAQQEGFNGVMPVPLALRCNFRSEQGIVDWVNATFTQAFPAADDVRRGRVSFTDAVAVRSPGATPAVELHGFWGESAVEQEAAALVAQVREGLDDPAVGSIAILCRSRNHVVPVLRALQARGINYAAQDIDKLAGSPAIVDLMSLCRALANPADRVAWFALLRAPWCGLCLDDLHRLGTSGENKRYQSLAALLAAPDPAARLSEEGQARVLHLASCLAWAERKRDRLALRVWVEQLWLRLGGPATLEQRRYLHDASRFFELLQQAEEEGVGLDSAWLAARLDRLFASGYDAAASLQVMTLHKAKGLEFDWVFIPALARTTRGQDRDLLLWDEYNGPAGESGFLLAADDHSADKDPSLYNFLKRLRQEKSRLETTRLLYVGATRAIKKLVLSACLNTVETGEEATPGLSPTFRDPADGSLLAPIWPVFREQVQAHEPLEQAAQTTATAGSELRRLAVVPASRAAGQETDAAGGGNFPQRLTNRVDRHVGTVVHMALEQLSLLPELPRQIPPRAQQQWRGALQRLGLAGTVLDTAHERVREAVGCTLADEQAGRWLLSPDHLEADSELALSCVGAGGAVSDIVIDRTFVDAASGERWIVDYKTSQPAEGESTGEFAAREARCYAAQLQDYRDAMAGSGDQPLRCALYFTCLGLLHPLPELDWNP